MTTKKRYNFRTQPTPEQLYALRQAVKHKRYGIFFQQRVGKTKVAIDFCGIQHMLEGAKKVLIVCPLSVRGEWEKQIPEHLSPDIPFSIYLYQSDRRFSSATLHNSQRVAPDKMLFTIINYDKLGPHRDVLLSWNPDIIIFDESHMLKHHTSVRSKAAYLLTKRTDKKDPNVLLLTGTPITHNWTDIFSQFRVMDSDIFGHRWTEFRDTYAIMGGYMGKQVVGCKDIEAIKALMKEHSVRVLRANVMDEPDVENITLTVPFEPSARKAYDTLKKSWTVELEQGGDVVADLAITRMMRLQQMCGGFATTEEGIVHQVSKAKAMLLKDLVATAVEGGEQVVIFHRFTAEVGLIESVLKAHKVGYYNGAVKEADRKKVKEAFQNGELDAIVVQVSTGAMGVSFDRAHINIFYSTDFSLQNYLQAKDRVMGRFQKSDVVTNYHLAVEKSIDELLLKTLAKNNDFASSVADSYKAVLRT